MFRESRDLFEFWEISYYNISLTVQDRQLVAMKDYNRMWSIEWHLRADAIAAA